MNALEELTNKLCQKDPIYHDLRKLKEISEAARFFENTIYIYKYDENKNPKEKNKTKQAIEEWMETETQIQQNIKQHIPQLLTEILYKEIINTIK